MGLRYLSGRAVAWHVRPWGPSSVPRQEGREEKEGKTRV
jgi:hypothetical protein